MAKKEAKTEEKTNEVAFDLNEALKECPKPEWYKRAFIRTIDTSKIKSNNDLIKAMKTYGEME